MLKQILLALTLIAMSGCFQSHAQAPEELPAATDGLAPVSGPCLNVVLQPVTSENQTRGSHAGGQVQLRQDLWPAEYLPRTYATAPLLPELQNVAGQAHRYLLHEAVYHLIRGQEQHTEEGLGHEAPETQAIPSDEIAKAERQLVITYPNLCILQAN